jgi:hypothetical protein
MSARVSCIKLREAATTKQSEIDRYLQSREKKSRRMGKAIKLEKIIKKIYIIL